MKRFDSAKVFIEPVTSLIGIVLTLSVINDTLRNLYYPDSSGTTLIIIFAVGISLSVLSTFIFLLRLVHFYALAISKEITNSIEQSLKKCEPPKHNYRICKTIAGTFCIQKAKLYPSGWRYDTIAVNGTTYFSSPNQAQISLENTGIDEVVKYL